MARLLESGDLGDEARDAMLEALVNLSRALAVETRIPEPAEPKDILLAPASHCWKEALPSIREFVLSAGIPAGRVSHEIETFLQPGHGV